MPYKEVKTDNFYYRSFSNTVSENSLKWHWDEEDRLIEPINTNDWFFQFDNELPFKINSSIFIEAGRIHRIIKGKTNLYLKIRKYI